MCCARALVAYATFFDIDWDLDEGAELCCQYWV